MTASAAAHPLLLDPDYPTLKKHLIESTGLAYYADKDGDLSARIAGRLTQLHLPNCAAYLDLLKDRQAGEAERHVVIGQLTIGETYFFRHLEQFDGLRDVVLPELIDRNQQSRTLRIWSAGCAIGAEPYSLAILLKQLFGHRLAGWDVRILGTDINQAFLARAGRGEFDERALRTTPDAIRREWFSPSGATWTIRADVKEWVSFQYHNLVEHPYPSIVHGIAALDLILCRNVLIYFDWPVIDGIIGRFHECLVDGGWLAVGHAESNPEIFRSYRTVNVPGATLYQRNGERTSTSCATAWTAPPLISPAPPDLPWSPPVLPTVPGAVRVDVDQPFATPALEGLAEVRRLADEGKWIDAGRRCEQLLERERLNPVVHFYQALIKEQMGQHLEAEAAFRKAIYLDRGALLAHYHLALLLGRTGRRENAVQSLRNVQQLLSKIDKHRQIADADGLTAEDLGRLVDLHLDLWRK